MNDIVYILKNDVEPNELRYSLRTVEKNFPHGRVFFFCGCPQGITPDRFVPFEQKGATKWERATSTFRKIAETEEVSEDFWLFNDDFFILQRIDGLPYMTRGLLSERVNELRERHGLSGYAVKLAETITALESRGLETRDYALHVPMLINKQKALEVLDAIPECPMFRSLYGNYHKVGGIKTDDVKIHDRMTVPAEGQTLLSTSDISFRLGRVGDYIRKNFTEASRWEI